jgi:hypothetical protein
MPPDWIRGDQLDDWLTAQAIRIALEQAMAS